MKVENNECKINVPAGTFILHAVLNLLPLCILCANSYEGFQGLIRANRRISE
jgi:hypothetical protein